MLLQGVSKRITKPYFNKGLPWVRKMLDRL